MNLHDHDLLRNRKCFLNLHGLISPDFREVSGVASRYNKRFIINRVFVVVYRFVNRVALHRG